jgi:hypothetical protein
MLCAVVTGTVPTVISAEVTRWRRRWPPLRSLRPSVMDLANDLLRLAERVAQVPHLSATCELAFQILRIAQVMRASEPTSQSDSRALYRSPSTTLPEFNI